MQKVRAVALLAGILVVFILAGIGACRPAKQAPRDPSREAAGSQW